MKHIIFAIFLLIVPHLSLLSQEKIKVKDGNRTTRAAIWVYQPEKNTRNTAVIICPGGSYHHLGINHEGHKVAQELIKHGFTAVVLRYRTGMYGYHYPAMMNDLQQSMDIIRDSSETYKVDKIGLIGFSAGGHLVGWMAENYKSETRPDFVVMGYPVVSMEDDIVHRYSRYNLLTNIYSRKLKRHMSLEKNIHRDMPPIFIFCSKDDDVVNAENTYRMIDSMRVHNVPYHSMILEEGGHGFGMMEDHHASALWFDEFIDWYEQLYPEQIINTEHITVQ
ncbi:MAG: alpha/beta hydrolase [Bacteroidales bacterium]|nr:alpha/beta hydrolase [Bacteroidales bacterium]MDD4670987.1 alpha/beta hydrolase [Bacteroidales bacterium]